MSEGVEEASIAPRACLRTRRASPRSSASTETRSSAWRSPGRRPWPCGGPRAGTSSARGAPGRAIAERRRSEAGCARSRPTWCVTGAAPSRRPAESFEPVFVDVGSSADDPATRAEVAEAIERSRGSGLLPANHRESPCFENETGSLRRDRVRSRVSDRDGHVRPRASARAAPRGGERIVEHDEARMLASARADDELDPARFAQLDEHLAICAGMSHVRGRVAAALGAGSRDPSRTRADGSDASRAGRVAEPGQT